MFLFLSLCLFVDYSQTKKPKRKKNLHNNRVYQTWVLCKFIYLFIYKRYSSLVYLSTVLHGTWVTKLEYHIIFFNRTNSNSTMPRWQNWWGTQVSETRVLKKVVLCHLFPKQCFFAKSFQKMWYLAILAGYWIWIFKYFFSSNLKMGYK